MVSQPSFHNALWEQSCTGGDCVEVAFRDGWVGLRDSKAGDDSPVLIFNHEEWDGFVTAIKSGQFDRPPL
ncbi:hypothetical protein GCM10023194_66120 [Planotetraspora phitsanulokensis]|uniref:DUF397 domain-containing protein n=1 Tax=Planotetraspora phitsanulokensis TaxID=575192 RepID=A0A8J3U609_9ACTN|nr:DUF397 domain-containing protein [Planotetraspora phitsanulokensis]GII38687.1 hypothetical protein Pph01_36900 [Planotetraspora phitsanulokensis]